MKYIIFAALLQVFVALTLLFSSKKRETSDWLLALFLGCVGWHLTTKFYIFTQADNTSVASMMHTFIQLAYGPLLFLYAEKKRNQRAALTRYWYLFVPVIIGATLYCCVIAAFYWQLTNAALLLDVYNNLTFLPIVVMLLLSGIIITIRNRNKEAAGYLLIHRLSTVLLLVALADILLTVASQYQPWFATPVRTALYSMLGIFPVIIIHYKYVASGKEVQTTTEDVDIESQQAATTAPAETMTFNGNETSPTNIPVRKLLLNTAQHQEIFDKIEALVKEKSLYKDEDFSLEKLAAASGVSRHYISETLNVFVAKTFWQYINEYRTEAVISILNSGNYNHLSLLSIAYDAGFKNKASFNQYFKKITGVTPSEYQRKRMAACAAE